MASTIWLGALFGQQDKTIWELERTIMRGRGLKAVIAKGNIIEGITAEW